MTDHERDAVEVWACMKMVQTFLDSLINNKYPCQEYAVKLACTLKAEIDGGILDKAKRLAKVMSKFDTTPAK